jgi:hypothetical protein
MNKKETTIMLKCDCGCSILVVDKEEWEDGEVDYNISVQDSRYDHNYTTLWDRIKSAVKVLLVDRFIIVIFTLTILKSSGSLWRNWINCA